ncbi:MAG TPA: hypothetical protein VFE34_00065 [Dongiaceae bacterium]|jgi:hypothetical protein|nr:hypothetical protein [Dongiaceae bacterium]
MTDLTLSHGPARAGTRWETRLVLGSVALLSTLAVADRATAWLIGEFPTYVPFWRLRFEFLRPIGVYYDMVERNFGGMSPGTFSLLALFAAALIGAGVVSRIRLARALACHLTFGVAAILGFMSWDPGFAMRSHAQVGMTSEPYAMLGMLLALIAAGLCLRIHAEYVGWNPASSRSYRRARIKLLRLRSHLGGTIADVIDRLGPATAGARTAPITARATRYQNRGR